jgi:hypothetical protein
MYTDLFSADLFEYQDIFASQLTVAVFLYATLVMIASNTVLALAVSLPDPNPNAEVVATT